MDFLLLVFQFFDDGEIIADVRVLRLSHKVVDVGLVLLSVAVNTTVALFEGNQAPGNVVVEHDVAEVVQSRTR